MVILLGEKNLHTANLIFLISFTCIACILFILHEIVPVMKSFIYLFVSVIIISSCSNEPKGPDVSGIPVSIELKRFDQDFFAIDSTLTREGLAKLSAGYPGFTPLFVGDVLGLGPIADTNQLVFDGTKRFLHLNKKVYDTAQLVFKKTDGMLRDIRNGFRHVKYYFPQYKVPSTIYTVIGPMDALAPMSNNEPSPNFIGNDFLAVSLQFYLGKDYSIYNDAGYASSIVPQFRSRRFSKEYIATDVFNLVIDDLFPDNSSRLPLIERFVEKGKRLNLLQQFLPGVHDTLITGYTGSQLEWCKKNERDIYNFFIQQNLLFEIDPALTKNFINEAPGTQGMPPESPGNIGAFIGLQVVKAYLKKHTAVSPEQLMRKPAKEIFNQSGYKPR
jgi:hypothetical protein